MKKTVLLIAAITLSLSILAQVAGNEQYEISNRFQQNANYNKDFDYVPVDKRYTYNDPYDQVNNQSMIVNVNVLLNAKADSYMAIFNMSQLGETAKDADKQFNERLTNFKNALKTNGIPAKDIFIDMISLVPVYVYEVEQKLFSKSYNEVPKGFELQKNIHIRFSNTEILDKIITIAAEYEIYDLVKVEYFVKDKEALYDQMKAKALEIYEKKKATFKSTGIDLDTIYHITSESINVAFPVDRYQSYQPYGGTTSVQALKKSANINQIRRPKTLFYNKLPYHKYDAIINAEILEPSVQYTYNLNVKYTIKEKQPKVINDYYILTTDGVLKKIDIK